MSVNTYNSTTGVLTRVAGNGGGSFIYPHIYITAETGSTVTITDGTATITAIETSEGLFEADVVNLNTYTITASLDGEEISQILDVDTVKKYTVIMGSLVPEGATVTPTDDIQIWLACAEITDKSYTTLAEVLADRETFETLIADSNACDYMARSTTWAGVTGGLVPTMTSNTTPSGIASSSTSVSGYEAYKAFDGSENSGRWQSTEASNAWVEYEFTNAKNIKGATIVPFVDGSSKSRIKNFKIQTYTTEWIDVYTGIMSNNSAKASFEFENDYTQSRWRLLILDNYGGSSDTCGIFELQFYQTGITTDADAMALIGKYDYCSNALLGNATWAEAIGNSDYWDSVCNVSVPNMTSNTAPSGEAFASSTYSSSYPAYYAFDGNNTTFWSSQSSGDQFVGYKFTNAVNIKALFIYPNLSAGTIYEFELQGSNDGSVYTPIDTFEVDGLTPTYVSINNDDSYMYYKISRTGGWQAYSIQFYGRTSSYVSGKVAIHGACNASIYYKDGGSDVSVGTTNINTGIALVNISDMPKGTYALYDGVAKDPSDLSNDYSKTVTITQNTTDVWLMPDAVKTLYWWGYMSDDCEELSTANGWTYKSGWPWKAPTYNTNDITLNAGSSGQYYYTGIATKHKLPLGTTVKAVGMGLSIASTIAMGLLNWNNGKAVSSDGNPIDYSSWSTINVNELKSFISTHEDYAEVVSWVGGRSGKLHAFWYE